MQKIVTTIGALEAALLDRGVRCVLLVCGSSIRHLPLDASFATLEERTGIRVVRFSDFHPNPASTSVDAGIRVYNENGCDAIVAVGGGSAMDVAKGIRVYAHMGYERLALTEPHTDSGIPLFAVPTTAGSGSEATQIAVIYVDGEKVSVDSPEALPETVLLDGSLLKSLPPYQKKSTLLDALCHATESFWSCRSTEESRTIAAAAIRGVLTHMDAYLAGDAGEAASAMLLAAFDAGRAISLTRTTAGHAMAYKLTTRYGFAHGHACALDVCVLWPTLCEAAKEDAVLRDKLTALAAVYGCATPEENAARFAAMVRDMQLPRHPIPEADIPLLAASVNTQRLANHPAPMTTEQLAALYRQIAAMQEENA